MLITVAIVGYALGGITAPVPKEAQQPMLFKTVREFKPFWVRIQPFWLPLLFDHGVTDRAEWDQLPSADNTSIGFTVLSPTLFYSDDSHRFFSNLDLSVAFEPLRPKELSTQGKELKAVTGASLSPLAPTVYFRERASNWEFLSNHGGNEMEAEIRGPLGFGVSVDPACEPTQGGLW